MIGEKIYTIDTGGDVRVWWFEIEGDKWRGWSGLVDGAITPSGWTTCVPRSKPTAEAQALFEANAELKKKLDRKYAHTVDEALAKAATKVEPMLAQKFSGWPSGQHYIFAQPKLDGVRCLATSRGLWSRNGKPLTATPHIEGLLERFFFRHPDAVLDGELYAHHLSDNFNEIISSVRSQKPSLWSGQIEYHVYDCATHTGVFGDRLKFLKDTVAQCRYIHLVETHRVVEQETLDALYASFTEQGYEGQMIRLDGPYEQKRSKLLLKRKEFHDEEFEIVRIEEGNGNWAGYAKRVVCRLPDGREFGGGIKGDQAFCKALLENPGRYHAATIRFFNFTPDGVPRFPVAVKFWDSEKI